MQKSADHFTLFVRKSGKSKMYYYYCYDADGCRRKRSTGARSRAAAMSVIAERIRRGELLDDRPQPSLGIGSRLLFSDIATDLFIEGACPICKDKEFRGKPYTPRVIKDNRRRLEKDIMPFFERIPLCDISVAVIKRWQLWLREEKGLSNATINRDRTTLLPILDLAVEEGFIGSNPARDTKPLYESKEPAREAFTMTEIDRLFSVEWASPLARTASLLAAFTGMRIGEVRALRGIDVSDDAVCISHSIDADGRMKCTKSGKKRLCPIPPIVRDELQRLIRDPDDLIFTISGKEPVAVSYLNDYLRYAMNEAGIRRKGLSFHSFRHFFNSQLIASGVNSEVVRSVVGHESEAMTERYLHLSREDLGSVRIVQDRIITSAKKKLQCLGK